MSMTEVIKEATLWLAWGGAGLAVLALIAFLIGWGAKFQLTGATIFTLLLSASCWAFEESYTPPVNIEGYKYAPIVYDNGFDLVVAQAPDDFPNESIKPTLLQIAGNLKGGGRRNAMVRIRIRKLEPAGNGITRPIILGEVVRDIEKNTTLTSSDLNVPEDSVTNLLSSSAKNSNSSP